MLTQDLLTAVKNYSEKMTQTVTFVLQTGEHDSRAELTDFLNKLVSVSDKLSLQEADAGLPSPISFKLLANEQDTGIVFSGIPGGHEFSSLVLAMLQAGGSELKLDASIQALIKNINTPLNFQTYVSLSCHNCPDVVQSLNQFALLNKHISNEMIDGGLFQAQVEAHNIQGVPAVFLNGKPFANGKIDTAKLIEKLLELDPNIMTSDAPTQGLPQQDVVIIGGGPAGVAAAIYTARKGLKVTIVADRIGGQVKDTQDIENLISIPLTNGTTLANNFATHMQAYNITVKEHLNVKSVQAGHADNGNIHTITLTTGEVIESRSVIIATGAKWRQLGVPGEQENIGQGVAYCPHCDGPFFKGKPVAVIGGGNSGVEAALDLAGIVEHVTIMEFMPNLKADQVLIDKANARDNIDILANVATKSINAENGKVTSITYTDRDTNEETTLDLAAVFIQIGLVPNSDFVTDVVERNKFGEIIIDERCRTNAKGIFACGDVSTVPFKQINIAMGEGSKAALSAFEYLMIES